METLVADLIEVVRETVRDELERSQENART